MGKVFKTDGGVGVVEHTNVGLAVGGKGNQLLILKGMCDALLQALGLVEYDWVPDGRHALRLESGSHVLGDLSSIKGEGERYIAVAEFDVEHLEELVSRVREYEPIAKYPSIMRDISLLVPQAVRVGDMMQLMEDISPKLIDDIDLIDYFVDEKKLGSDRKSFTFRIVFLCPNRTLTDIEVNNETKKIQEALVVQFGVEIR